MTTGVILMSYGSPGLPRNPMRDDANGEGASSAGGGGEAAHDEMRAYLTRVRGGREPSDETVGEFVRRYAAIGGSPLIPITAAQAFRLERALGRGFLCGAGMRFSNPTIADVVADLQRRGAERILGIIISPQYSPIIMGGYGRALTETGAEHRVVEGWWDEPAFVAVMADRLRRGLLRMPPGTPVLLTAHSLPKRVVDQEPGFVDQLRASAQLIADAAALPPEQWRFAYQSAGHTPEEWLKPDILDALPELAAEGHRHVLVAPVQFIGDHLETLYDIDIGGREQADAAGFVGFARVPAPNADSDLVEALAGVVRRNVTAWDAVPTAAAALN